MSLQIRMSGLLVGYSTRSSYDVLNRQIQITPDVSLSEPPIGFSYTSTGQRASMIDSTATTTDDAHDRLISKSTPQGTLSYGYDLAGNLISTQSNHANGMTIIYTYDGDGNRVAQTTGGITTTFLVDEINPTGYAQVVEELVGGTVQRTYTYGLDLISQNHWNGSAWTPSYHLADGLGSVRTLTDASGSATDSYVYDAFGSQIATSGSTPNRYGFTGEQFDDDLGLYYLRARYYNQSNGRFLSRDTYPLNQIRPREWNRYSYVAGDPVNAVDPSGLTAIAQQGMHFNLETLKAIPKAILLGWSVSCILTLVSQQIGVLLRGNCTIYSGVIQIQGDDITGTTSGAVPDKAGQGYMISQAWYLNRPLTAPEARSRLAALMMVLTYEQKMNRYSTQVNSLSAYEKAVRLTYECQSNGGCLPLNISYKNPEFKDKRFAPRIDMIISAGKNFT